MDEKEIETTSNSEFPNESIEDVVNREFDKRWDEREVKLREAIISEYLRPQAKEVKEENIEIKPKERSLFF